jgi:hypothetical protein
VLDKKQILINLSLNLALALNVLFSQSIISLVVLSTIFLMSIALLVHICYLAVNDIP